MYKEVTQIRIVHYMEGNEQQSWNVSVEKDAAEGTVVFEELFYDYSKARLYVSSVLEVLGTGVTYVRPK